MARQFSAAVRNAMLDAYEVTIGTAPKLQLRTGAPPADASVADSGTLIDEITLPSDWLAAAAAGSKSLIGSWVAAATAGGTVGHFRVKNSAGTVTHDQGTVTATGGGGDMTLDNNVIASGQQVTITAFTLNAGNA